MVFLTQRKMLKNKVEQLCFKALGMGKSMPRSLPLVEHFSFFFCVVDKIPYGKITEHLLTPYVTWLIQPTYFVCTFSNLAAFIQSSTLSAA
ncbi:hypothetical protein NUACC26_045740 [Scytonema sp. NUACC26]